MQLQSFAGNKMNDHFLQNLLLICFLFVVGKNPKKFHIFFTFIYFTDRRSCSFWKLKIKKGRLIIRFHF